MAMVSKICKLHARQIFDSRGNPTVEVELTTNKGIFRAAVPSGASTGIHEAVELRDGNGKDYFGKGVLKAVQNVNDIIGPKMIDAKLDITDQAAVDRFLINLDASLGANAILGVSMAVARAGAAEKNLPLYEYIAQLSGNKEMSLPCPALNVINGGAHASNALSFQEFMIMPTGAKSFAEAMKMGTEVYHHLKQLLQKKYHQEVQVGDEGGFAPKDMDSASTVLTVIEEAIAAAGHTGKFHLAMDVAASEFMVEGGKYDLDLKKKDLPASKHRILTGAELVEEYKELKRKFPRLISIEDPFEQDDFDSWVAIRKALSIQVVGDDLTVTNVARIKKAMELNACNALLLKINQIGTITESIEAAKLVKANGWGLMVSHRSGETEDTFIADLAVGLNAGQIKSGAPSRSERLAKYNQMLRIEEALGSKAVYAGPAVTNVH